jgi:hypothetical protein
MYITVALAYKNQKCQHTLKGPLYPIEDNKVPSQPVLKEWLETHYPAWWPFITEMEVNIYFDTNWFAQLSCTRNPYEITYGDWLLSVPKCMGLTYEEVLKVILHWLDIPPKPIFIKTGIPMYKEVGECAITLHIDDKIRLL